MMSIYTFIQMFYPEGLEPDPVFLRARCGSVLFSRVGSGSSQSQPGSGSGQSQPGSGSGQSQPRSGSGQF